MMRAFRLFLLLAFISLSLTGCGNLLYLSKLGWHQSSITFHSVPVEEVLENAGVDGEAKEKIDSGAVQLIDVRTPGEFNGGHAPGEINIPHMSVVSQKDKLATDKPIVMICQMGSRSALACEFAAALGIKDIYNVEGGTEAWIKAGYATE